MGSNIGWSHRRVAMLWVLKSTLRVASSEVRLIRTYIMTQANPLRPTPYGHPPRPPPTAPPTVNPLRPPPYDHPPTVTRLLSPAYGHSPAVTPPRSPPYGQAATVRRIFEVANKSKPRSLAPNLCFWYTKRQKSRHSALPKVCFRYTKNKFRKFRRGGVGKSRFTTSVGPYVFLLQHEHKIGTHELQLQGRPRGTCE